MRKIMEKANEIIIVNISVKTSVFQSVDLLCNNNLKCKKKINKTQNETRCRGLNVTACSFSYMFLIRFGSLLQTGLTTQGLNFFLNRILNSPTLGKPQY